MKDTASQIREACRDFRHDGYVMFPGFLNPGEVAELRANVERFIRDVVPEMPPNHVFYENKADASTLKQLQQMFTYDPYFRALAIGSRFEKWAERLLADCVVARNMQYFNKPPGVGQPTPPHQDGFYFKLEPCEALTMWLALEDVDEENGCVRYVRGSHLRGMRPHQRTQTLGFSQAMADYGRPEDVANEVVCPAQPGDLLVHHALTIHRADANRSRMRTRKAMGWIYYAGRAKEDVAGQEAYQTKLQSELAAAGKI